MITHAFVVTSAVNSKFGVFTPEQRLAQTIDTIKSIRARIPDARIFVMECCGTPITDEQKDLIGEHCHTVVDCSRNEEVQALYDNDNWDVVKNGTEIMVFGGTVAELRDAGYLDGIDRIHKMSGRYVLNDQFDPAVYEQSDVVNKIVIGPKQASQFPEAVTTVPLQYMARLWSWPASMTDEIIDIYEQSFVFFAQRLQAGGYVDIEHVLYKFLPPEHVHEIPVTGVEGQIAPNGQAIKN